MTEGTAVTEKQTLRQELNDVEKEVSTLTFSISKAVPWSLIGVIVLQSMMLFFWAGQLEATFESHVEIAKERFMAIDRQLDDRYRASQAQSDLALRDERIAHNSQANIDFKRSLDRLAESQESRFQELFNMIRNTHLHNTNGDVAP